MDPKPEGAPAHAMSFAQIDECDLVESQGRRAAVQRDLKLRGGLAEADGSASPPQGVQTLSGRELRTDL
jgi:hypothetical protein